MLWVHSISADDAALNQMRRRFGFSEMDLREVRPPLQRPKLVIRPGYLFMILLFPYYDRKSGEIWISEVDFFITRNTLVTVNHRGELPALRGFLSACSKDRARHDECLRGGVTTLLYKILDVLHDAAFPMLVHISQDIDAVEEGILDIGNRTAVEEILRIKTNIVDFRRAMQGHKPVVERLIARGEGFIETKTFASYWSDLVDATKEIWTFLEVQRDTINALHETHASLLSFRTNEVMKTLTIVSVILLPLTVITGVFGMNAVGLPLVDHPQGFYIVIGVMTSAVLIMLGIFKAKKWI